VGLLFGFCSTTLPTLTRLGDQLDDPRAPNPPYNRHLSISRRALPILASAGPWAWSSCWWLVQGMWCFHSPWARRDRSGLFVCVPGAAVLAESAHHRRTRRCIQLGARIKKDRLRDQSPQGGRGHARQFYGGRLRHGQDLGAAACETGRWARQVLRCGKIAVLQLQTHEHAGLAQTFVSCVLTIIAFADPKVCASPVLRYL